MCRSNKDGGRRCPGCGGFRAAAKANGNRRLGRLARKKVFDYLTKHGLTQTAKAILAASPSLLPEFMAELGIDPAILGDTPMPSTHSNPPSAGMLVSQAIAERQDLTYAATPQVHPDRPIRKTKSRVTETSSIEGALAAATVDPIAADAVPLAAISAEETEFQRAISGTVKQTEGSLVERFQAYLEGTHNRVVARYKIQTPAGVLYTDAADTTANILYEAKGTAERMSVRLALGQVLDYGRYVKHCSLAILLPIAPAADLVDLLKSHRVGCVVEGPPGRFADMTSLGRCP